MKGQRLEPLEKQAEQASVGETIVPEAVTTVLAVRVGSWASLM